jgi:hypothetical protein
MVSSINALRSIDCMRGGFSATKTMHLFHPDGNIMTFICFAFTTGWRYFAPVPYRRCWRDDSCFARTQAAFEALLPQTLSDFQGGFETGQIMAAGLDKFTAIFRLRLPLPTEPSALPEILEDGFEAQALWGVRVRKVSPHARIISKASIPGRAEPLADIKRC